MIVNHHHRTEEAETKEKKIFRDIQINNSSSRAVSSHETTNTNRQKKEGFSVHGEKKREIFAKNQQRWQALQSIKKGRRILRDYKLNKQQKRTVRANTHAEHDVLKTKIALNYTHIRKWSGSRLELRPSTTF